jgi:uncharacterized membrane protein
MGEPHPATLIALLVLIAISCILAVRSSRSLRDREREDTRPASAVRSHRYSLTSFWLAILLFVMGSSAAFLLVSLNPGPVAAVGIVLGCTAIWVAAVVLTALFQRSH